MRGVESRPSRCSLLLLQAFGLALAPAAAPARGASVPEPALWPRVLIQDEVTRAAVLWALQDAAERLAQPACQALLSDFKAHDGQPLREKLDPLGVTPAGYLPLILFRNGSGEGRCRAESVAAYTAPGARVVYVCGRRFEDLWRREPWLAQTIVIHEALHTLGLGENPPSSMDIARHVRKRCVG